MVVGHPLATVGAAYRRAGPGDVVVCSAAREILGSLLRCDPIDGLYSKAVAVAARQSVQTSPEVPRLTLEELRRLLPTVVLDRAAALEGRWLAEIRNLSVVQVRLNEIGFDSELLPTLHDWVSEIEKASVRLEGEVLQTLMDDKGVSAIVVFGLPPFAHEDDPLRAIDAALAIHQSLTARGRHVSIGVTTGLSFCGEFGGERRRDYSALGVAINLSSRLMEQAGNGVLCDAATASAVENRVSFSATTRLNLKGWSNLVAAFRPEAISRSLRSRVIRRTIGRESERRILRDALDRLNHGVGGIVRIEGEAGIGKSTLLLNLIETARDLNLRALHGAAAAIDRATPYYAWREVLGQLYAPHGAETATKLFDALGGKADLADWLPLLEDIIPLGLSANALTRSMLGSSRAAGIEELVVFFLGSTASRQPTLVVFDDAQWMDGASISLARAVAHRLPGLLLVLARRSAGEPAEVNRMVDIEPDIDIALGGLPNERVIEIVCQRLGVSSVPSALAELITMRAAGNPFYCEELTFAMRDTGILRVEHGECRAPDDLSANGLIIPASIKSVVVARFDALPPENQLILKVASAFGGGFSLDFLRAVYPRELQVDQVQELLDELIARNMLNSSISGAGLQYEFRHAIFENAIYELLSFAQRRELHKAIAGVIESRHRTALEPFHAQLARHWELAGRADIAVVYLERAAAQGLRSYANLDAIRYLRKAIQLSETGAAPMSARALATWQSMLGDAHHELMEFDRASLHYRNAMKALGYREPSTPVELTQGLLVNALRQAKHRFLMTPRTASSGADMQRVAHMYERLSEEYFYSNNPLRLLHGTLASLNLAEQSGAVAETIAGYNALALGLGMAGLPGVARRYARRALRLAAEKGDFPDVARAYLVAGVLTYGLGDWDAVRDSAMRSAQLFRQLGDRVRLATAATMAVYESLLRCDLARAETDLDSLSDIIAADPNTNAEVRAWRLCAQVSLDALRGEVASATLDELREVCAAGQPPANLLLCLGAMGVGYLQIGDLAAATQTAIAGAETLRKSHVVWAAFGALGAGGVVQTLIALWRLADDKHSTKANALRQTAEEAVGRFYRLSKRSPVCWPWALLSRGQAAFLAGRQDAARRDWVRAANSAQRLGMPHAVGLAYYELGAHSHSGDRARTDYLQRAEHIFATHGADHDLARLRGASAGVGQER